MGFQRGGTGTEIRTGRGEPVLMITHGQHFINNEPDRYGTIMHMVSGDNVLTVVTGTDPTVEPDDIRIESQDVADHFRKLTAGMRKVADASNPPGRVATPRGTVAADGRRLPKGMRNCPSCHGCHQARETCLECDGNGYVRVSP